MAVAHDAASESAVAASVASFSWNHTPAGTPRGAIVFVLTVANAGVPLDTGVTYDGKAMTLIGSGADTDTEPAAVRCYYCDGVSATSPASIVVSRTNNAVQMMGMAATVVATYATQAYAAGRVTTGGSASNTGANTSSTGVGTIAEVSVDDGSPGSNSVRYAACYTGAASPPTAGGNSTLLNNHDFTAFGWTMVRETTAGQGSRSVGMTAGSDDRAGVHIAVREILFPTVFDAVTVAETVTQVLSPSVFSVNDAVTVAETVNPAIQLGIVRADAVTVTEDVALAAVAGVSLIAQYRSVHRGLFPRVFGRVN
jgi:hypothetical protein